MEFRFYLYISTSKVDMLLPQLVRATGRTHATEIGVDVKIAKAAYRQESSPDADVSHRLERLVGKLDKAGAVGDLVEPGRFFRARMSMRWGALQEGCRQPLLFFGGREGGTVVGLGGSVHHALGTSPAQEGGQVEAPVLARSLLPSLVDGLQLDPEVARALDGVPPGSDTALASAVKGAVDRLNGPTQSVEFVAQTLWRTPGDGARDSAGAVLLGSPLYVALAD